MKRLLICVLIVMFLTSVVGCGSSKVIDGVEYETYGFINKDTYHNSKIKYQVITGNVIWGVILFGSVAFPVYFFGFSLYEPMEKITENK